MSNPQQPQKRSKKQQPTSPSRTSSTPTEEADESEGERPFDPALAMDVLDRALENQEALREEVQPIKDFHAALEGAREDDLRIYWDVRIVRGKDTPFTATSGTSSLPGALSSKMKANAPSAIQQEVVDKIAQPLTAALMQEGEDQNFDQMQISEESEVGGSMSPISYGKGGGDEVLSLANEGAQAPEEDPTGEEGSDPDE